MKIPRRTGAPRAAIPVGRDRRRGGADDLARGLLERTRRASSSTCTAVRAASGSTRSSPTATSRPPAATRSSATCCPATPTASATSSCAGWPPRTPGMDLLGMDVTWTAEFAEAGWIRELTPRQAAAATQGHAPAADRHGDLEGQAVRHPAHHERPAAVVPQVARAEPADDVRRDDAAGPALKDQGKPYEIGFTAAQYEGYVVNINNLIKGFGGRVVNEDSTAPRGRRQDRARRSPC